MTHRRIAAFCSRLEGAGISEADAGYGADKNWIKDVCRKCPYEKCVLDKPNPHALKLERQYQVGKLTEKGWSAKQIALKLGICEMHVYKLRKESSKLDK